MIELSKQVGDLAALVMVREKYYFRDKAKENSKYFSPKEKIADELSDLLFMVIRISEYYKIDLEEAHLEALDSAYRDLKSRGV